MLLNIQDYMSRAIRGDTQVSPENLELFVKESREAIEKQFGGRSGAIEGATGADRTWSSQTGMLHFVVSDCMCSVGVQQIRVNRSCGPQ